MTCLSCSQINGGLGLTTTTPTGGGGGIDPATITALMQAFVHAKDLWNDIQQIFGIGAGRHEADIIVPIQNQLTNTILAPVGDFLQQVRTGLHVPTCTECSTWLGQLKQAQTSWLNYLHNTQWQDGRAAQQAEATLAPIFKSQLDELQQCVTAKCGTAAGGGGSVGAIFTNTDGSVNVPMVALSAGILYALMK